MKADDQQLISRLKSGDEQAMAQLLQSHWTGLVRYAYGLLGDWDGAEDVAQGAYARLWANRDRWTPESSAALLYRITRNAVLDVLKSRSHAAKGDVPDTLAASDTPERDVELAQLEEAAANAVEALPPRRREVFRLARERGFSYAEIAEITQLSRQTVANHMSLALSDLRVMLRPFLQTAEEDEGTANFDSPNSTEPSQGRS